jgi:hypothetical protein
LNPDLALVRSLRRVLESASEGKGMARSVVEELRPSSLPWSRSAKLLLLGHPIRTSMEALLESPYDEAAMLASLIVASAMSSALLVGKKGEVLAGTLERWVKAKENRRLEEKVMRFRSMVTSGVLGAVTAMVASLGPLVGSLNFEGASPAVDPLTLLVGGAAMAAIGSAVLGFYMSGKGFPLNVAVTLGVFVLVSAAVSPLGGLTPTVIW